MKNAYVSQNARQTYGRTDVCLPIHPCRHHPWKPRHNTDGQWQWKAPGCCWSNQLQKLRTRLRQSAYHRHRHCCLVKCSNNFFLCILWTTIIKFYKLPKNTTNCWQITFCPLSSMQTECTPTLNGIFHGSSVITSHSAIEIIVIKPQVEKDQLSLVGLY